MKVLELNNTQLTKRYKNNFTEVICKNQRQKIRKNKSIKINELKEVKNEEYIKELKNTISFNTNSSSWEKNSFDSDLIFKEDTPLIKMSWEETSIESSSRGINIEGSIFRSKQTLNMENFSVEMNIGCYLAGDSSCWIINRVNDYFDEQSFVIKIEKAEKSQKLFASFGTFVRDSQDNLIFKTFIKEQLIDFSKAKNKFYTENDISFIKIILVDTCDDIALAKIYVNDSKTENKIISNFLLPMKDRRRVMIAGNGEKCLIKNFTSRNVDLNKKMANITRNSEMLNTSLSKDFNDDKVVNNCNRNPNCCLIF